MDPKLLLLATLYGIHQPAGFQGFIDNPAAQRNFALAMDAQPQLVTVGNSGIPAFLANYNDPKVIEVLTSPMEAATIAGEAKKGDWTTLTAMFPIVESVGETSAYGDFNNNGMSDANANFEFRESFHYQTFTQWGERQLEIMGLARIDWAQRLNVSSALNIAKFMNKMSFFGVANLENYGLLNDPALSTPITPSTKTAGGTSWNKATVEEIFDDCEAMYEQAVKQCNGLLKRDAKMTLALGPTREALLTRTNIYGRNVYDNLTKNFKNLRIISAVEYETNAGELAQWIVDEIEGQQTMTTAFTEKMRAHAVVTAESSWRQKKSAGGWGTIIFTPYAVSQMLGI